MTPSLKRSNTDKAEQRRRSGTTAGFSDEASAGPVQQPLPPLVASAASSHVSPPPSPKEKQIASRRKSTSTQLDTNKGQAADQQKVQHDEFSQEDREEHLEQQGLGVVEVPKTPKRRSRGSSRGSHGKLHRKGSSGTGGSPKKLGTPKAADAGKTKTAGALATASMTADDSADALPELPIYVPGQNSPNKGAQREPWTLASEAEGESALCSSLEQRVNTSATEPAEQLAKADSTSIFIPIQALPEDADSAVSPSQALSQDQPTPTAAATSPTTAPTSPTSPASPTSPTSPVVSTPGQRKGSVAPPPMESSSKRQSRRMTTMGSFNQSPSKPIKGRPSAVATTKSREKRHSLVGSVQEKRVSEGKAAEDPKSGAPAIDADATVAPENSQGTKDVEEGGHSSAFNSAGAETKQSCQSTPDSVQSEESSVEACKQFGTNSTYGQHTSLSDVDEDEDEVSEVLQESPPQFFEGRRTRLFGSAPFDRPQDGRCSVSAAHHIRASLVLNPELTNRFAQQAVPPPINKQKTCGFRGTVVVFPVFEEKAKDEADSASSEEDSRSQSSSEDTKSSTDSEKEALIVENEKKSMVMIASGRSVTQTATCSVRPVSAREGLKATRRPVLIPGLELLPYIEHDSAFVAFETIFKAEAQAMRRPQLRRARIHYHRMVERYPTNYAVLVNLACCHAMLGQHVKALPLLDRAVMQFPGRGGAHINQVLCLMQLGDHEAAAAAIERAFIEAKTDLSRAHTVLLHRCRARLLLYCQAAALPGGDERAQDRAFALNRRAMTMCCSEAASAAEEDTLERPPEEGSLSTWAMMFPHGPSEEQGIPGVGFLEDLRAGLGSLKARTDEIGTSFRAWGRRHVYQSDDRAHDNYAPGGGTNTGIQKWCPLRPAQLEALRREMAKDTGECGEASDDDEALDRGRLAYEAAQQLSFLRRLEKIQAIRLLNLAELVELETDEYVFKQGDPADFMYVIASGAVRIEAVIGMYGPHPVTLDTFYDGQSFGEKLAAAMDDKEDIPRRRASVVAQEPTVLLRFFPMDYRRVIGAAVEGNAMPMFATAARDRRSACKEQAQKPELITKSINASQQAVRNRVRGLKTVPFLGEAVRAAAAAQVPRGACSSEAEKEARIIELMERHLFLFATNAQELELRYGDEVVRIGQSPRGCFIIAEGFCKLTVPVNGVQHEIDDDPGTSGNGPNPSSRDTGDQVTKRSAATPDLQQRPDSADCHGTLRKSSTTAFRRCGRSTPRQGRPALCSVRPWMETLRAGPPVSYKSTQSAKEIDMGWLYPGQAFGLGALWDSKGDCPYTAALTVRVESSEARILVMTERSLWYLPDTVAHQVRAKSRETTDPCRPSSHIIREEIREHKKENKERQEVLAEMSNRAD